MVSRTCNYCGLSTSDFQYVTIHPEGRREWIEALAGNDPAEKARLENEFDSCSRPVICRAHFPSDAFYFDAKNKKCLAGGATPTPKVQKFIYRELLQNGEQSEKLEQALRSCRHPPLYSYSFAPCRVPPRPAEETLLLCIPC